MVDEKLATIGWLIGEALRGSAEGSAVDAHHHHPQEILFEHLDFLHPSTVPTDLPIIHTTTSHVIPSMSYTLAPSSSHSRASIINSSSVSNPTDFPSHSIPHDERATAFVRATCYSRHVFDLVKTYGQGRGGSVTPSIRIHKSSLHCTDIPQSTASFPPRSSKKCSWRKRCGTRMRCR